MIYYALFLNPMSGRMEERNCIAIGDRLALEKLLSDCRCEPWSHTDSSGKVWNKSFKEGSELEWFNPPEHCDFNFGVIKIGSREEYCEKAGQEFDAFVNRYIRH